jgi:hypothetical protein
MIAKVRSRATREFLQIEPQNSSARCQRYKIGKKPRA